MTQTRQQKNLYKKEYYRANPEKRSAVWKKWYETNKEKAKEISRASYQKRREEAKLQMNKRYKELRNIVLNHYGGVCDCCGESNYEFLALDHINGGGGKHAKEVGGGSKMIRWIIKNNYPPIFRVLCHNCNMALGSYGFCPHENLLNTARASRRK